MHISPSHSLSRRSCLRGAEVVFDTKNNHPLSNLYVSMLQQLGIEVGAFLPSKGTMRGLEMA